MHHPREINLCNILYTVPMHRLPSAPDCVPSVAMTLNTFPPASEPSSPALHRGETEEESGMAAEDLHSRLPASEPAPPCTEGSLRRRRAAEDCHPWGRPCGAHKA